jgi:hypothetical protein
MWISRAHMAEQNKTVLIVGVVIVALVVIGVGSYFLFSGSTPPPVVMNQPAPPTDNAPPPEEGKPRATHPRDTDQPTKPKIGRGGEKSSEDATDEVREKKTRSVEQHGTVP